MGLPNLTFSHRRLYEHKTFLHNKDLNDLVGVVSSFFKKSVTHWVPWPFLISSM